MSEIISIRNTNATPKSFLDRSRPLPMVASDAIYKKIVSLHGNSPQDVLETTSKLFKVIKESRSFELDKVWESLEKELHNKKPLRTISKTDIAKFQTAFGMFYNMLNDLDGSASTSTLDLVEFQAVYLEAQDHTVRRILPGQSGIDSRNLQRAMTTISDRLVKVIERFNTRVDAGEIAGPKV